MQSFEVAKEVIASLILQEPNEKKVNLGKVETELKIGETIALFAKNKDEAVIATVEAKVTSIIVDKGPKNKGHVTARLFIIPGSERQF